MQTYQRKLLELQFQRSMQNSSSFVSIKNVSKVYPTPVGSYTVLENVNLAVKEGEFCF